MKTQPTIGSTKWKLDPYITGLAKHKTRPMPMGGQ